jgi:hypothetical protein
MSMIDWRIKGLEVTTCNCDWGCPCQFSSLPTHGHCRAAVAIRIEQGHFGDTRLDGLTFAGLFAWPKAIHEGHGEAFPIIDASASPKQRDAVLTILSGKESEPGSNMFSIFASTLETVHAPLFKSVDFSCDIDACTGSFSVANVVTVKAEPIPNVVTGAKQRVRVLMPGGFEFTEAEFGTGQVRTSDAPISLSWDKAHAHLCRLHMTGQGLVRN